MRTFLFAAALCMYWYAAGGQQSLSGTIVYSQCWIGAPEFPCEASVYLFDSSTTDLGTVQLLEMKIAAEEEQHWYLARFADSARRQRSPGYWDVMHAIAIEDSLEKENALRRVDLNFAKRESTLNHFITQAQSQQAVWDSLEHLAYGAESSPLFSCARAKKTRTVSSGRYLIYVETPGVYYLLIRPKNTQAWTAARNRPFKCFLVKLVIDGLVQKRVDMEFKI